MVGLNHTITQRREMKRNKLVPPSWVIELPEEVITFSLRIKDGVQTFYTDYIRERYGSILPDDHAKCFPCDWLQEVKEEVKKEIDWTTVPSGVTALFSDCDNIGTYTEREFLAYIPDEKEAKFLAWTNDRKGVDFWKCAKFKSGTAFKSLGIKFKEVIK